jgi:hypothetical protein
MPVQRGKDRKGSYYQWGDSGKRYYYETGNKDSREAAAEMLKKILRNR